MILVVEDNEDIRALLLSLLSSEGYVCIGAATATAAKEVVEAAVPRLMIIDRGLPDVDGIALLRGFREPTAPTADVPAEEVAIAARPQDVFPEAEVSQPAVEAPALESHAIEPLATDPIADGKLTTAASLAESLPPETIDLSVDDSVVAAATASTAATAPAASEAIDVESLALAAGESAMVGDEDDVVAIAPAVDDVTTEPLAEDVAHLPVAEEADRVVTQDVFVDPDAGVEPQATEALEPVDVAAVEAEAPAAIEPAAPLAESADDAVVSLSTAEPTPAAESSEAPVEATPEAPNEAAAVVEEPLTGRKGRKPRKPAAPKAPKAPKGARQRKSPKATAAEIAAAVAAENAAAASLVPTPVEPLAEAPAVDAAATETPVIEVPIAEAPAPETAAEVVEEADFASEPIAPLAEVAADTLGASPIADASAAEEEAVPADATTIAEAMPPAEAPATPLGSVAPIAEALAPPLTTLEDIADVASPIASLPVGDIIVPSRVALEPDELPIEQAEEIAPIELDEYRAGDVIATRPTTLNEVEVELVSPMFDPDPSTVSERDALDGIDSVIAEDKARAAEEAEATAAAAADVTAPVFEAPAIEAPVVETPTMEATVVVDEEEDVELITPESRPLMAADAALVDIEEEPIETDALAEEPTETVELLPVAAADAVASSLEVVADAVEDEDAPLAPAEEAVSFVPTAPADEPITLVADVNANDVETDALATVVDDVSPIAPSEAAIEGASLVAVETSEATADLGALDAVAEEVGELNAQIIPVAATSQPTVLAFDVPADALAAPEAILEQPAPLDGSTLVAAERLPLDTFEPEALDQPIADTVVEAPAAQKPASLMTDEPDLDVRFIARESVPARPVADEIQAPKQLPNEAISIRSKKPTGVVNVKVPSLDELEASFKDAFAEALAMAEGASFAKPAAEIVPTVPAAPMQTEVPAAAAELPVADAPAVAPAPAMKPAPKWELDESLLDQVNAKQTPVDPLAGSMGGPAGFLSLGGIGWIGDDASDQYEQMATTLKPSAFPGGVRPLTGPLGGQRSSRRRRPVAGSQAPADSAALASNDAVTPIGEDAIGPVGAADDLSDELSEPLTPAELPADDAGVTTLTSGPALEDVPAQMPPASYLPPRPRRERPVAAAQAGVDESLAAATPASPFAEQTLPLVDAFSHGPVAGLDEMLAKLGTAEGQIKDTPPITQDLPAGDRGVAPSPFASQVPIQASTNPNLPGVRRTRQQVNKLPLLMMLMVGLMVLAGLGSWYWPVPVTVRGEVAFANLGRTNTIERANTQDKIRAKLSLAAASARRSLPDRFGNGFLDRQELFSTILDNARFETRNETAGVLVLDYRSTVNQVDYDIERMNALVAQVVSDNKDLLEAQQKLRNELATLDSLVASNKSRIQSLNNEIAALRAIFESAPDGNEVRKVEADVASLEEARKAAARELDLREAELSRLEATAMLLVPASQLAPDDPLPIQLATIDDTLPLAPATRPASSNGAAANGAVANGKNWRAELDKLLADRNAAQSRLDQLVAAQTPEARAARERFDQSLSEFAATVESASKSLGDRPEVLQYVDSARRLQEQIRGMTDTLVRRQQQQLTRLAELKQRLSELNDANQEQRFANDPQLKDWTDKLAIQERLLNAARADNAPAKEIEAMEAQISLLRNMIAGQREMLNDPRAQSVTKQLEDMIGTTQREMAADRDMNDKLLADIQESFRRQQPAVEKLPDDQKQLAETLATRLAQIDLARQRYTDSLAISAGGEELQISELRTKLAALAPQIVEAQSYVDADAVAQAAEMQRRTEAAAMIETARKSVADARTALTEAESKYEARRRTLANLREKYEAARRAAERSDGLKTEEQRILATINTSIAQQKQLKDRLEFAVVPESRQQKAFALENDRTDPRLIYGASSVGLIGLLFGTLVVRDSRRHIPMAQPVRTEQGNPIPNNARTA